MARHLNVIEKESRHLTVFFYSKSQKGWCERKREKADYFSSFVARLVELGSIDWNYEHDLMYWTHFELNTVQWMQNNLLAFGEYIRYRALHDGVSEG